MLITCTAHVNWKVLLSDGQLTKHNHTTIQSIDNPCLGISIRGLSDGIIMQYSSPYLAIAQTDYIIYFIIYV